MSAPIYSINPGVATELAAAAALAPDLRLESLRQTIGARQRGGLDVLMLLSEVLGLAVSVGDNCHEQAKEYLQVIHGYSSEKADRLNLPSAMGALLGIHLAQDIRQEPLCEGCAFRVGAPANQCITTGIDASDGSDFMCHMRGVKDGECSARCAGAVQQERKMARARAANRVEAQTPKVIQPLTNSR